MAWDDSGTQAEGTDRRGLRVRWVLGAMAAALATAVAGGALDLWVALAIAVPAVAAALLPVRRPAVAAQPDAQPAAAPVEGRLAALIGALPEPALLLDSNGTVLVVNERVSRTVSKVKAGDPVSFAVRAPEVLEAVRLSALDGAARRVEFGERVPVERRLEAHIVPIRFNPAAPAAVPDVTLLTVRDLTQQHRVEQMRVDFVANASHELRTPLASLSGFIETLQGPARNDTQARERFLKIMAAQAWRMSRLIDDLLSLSRIELNAHLRPEAEVDLGAVIGHVRDTLGPLAAERGVSVSFEAPDEPVLVRGDRDELIRVFENLVENALKYGGTGGRVDVALSTEPADAPDRAGDAVTVIRDFGPGIAPEHLPRLTERFYRIDTTQSREQGGTGLGLAIVKHILARHRGRLNIESAPGAGATFTVRLAKLAGADGKIAPKSAA